MIIISSKQSLLLLISSLIIFSSLFFIAEAHETEHPHDELAQASSSTSSTSQDRVEQRQEMREEKRTTLQQVKQQRIINLSANISNRMEAAMTRFYNIISRLETRIEKLKQDNVDTASASTKLREASQLLAEAKTKLKDIDTLVINATTSEQPQSDWKEVRETYLEAGRLIRASHQALRETIALLKTAVAAADLQKSSAVSNDNSTTSKTE